MTTIADIESPYNAADEDTLRRNILYARIACRWALGNGYFPYASHLFFTQPGILDDDVPEERTLGIEAGKAIVRDIAPVSLFFLDLGESPGMRYGREDAAKANRTAKEIRLFDDDMTSSDYSGLLARASEQGLLPGGYQRLGW